MKFILSVEVKNFIYSKYRLLSSFLLYYRMSFKDFTDNFQKLEICNLGLDSLDEEQHTCHKKRWETKKVDGAWVPRVNAGGCRNYLGKYLLYS